MGDKRSRVWVLIVFQAGQRFPRLTQRNERNWLKKNNDMAVDDRLQAGYNCSGYPD
jgi:hypothetical protein